MIDFNRINISMDHSTIAAIATPPGSGGIGVVKISGKDALSIAEAIFRRSGSSCTGNGGEVKNTFSTHRLYHGYIVNEETGKVLDEVLMAVMQAPHSYTREDVVEIQAHSGVVALSAILELVLSNGARLAEAGEFTKRAFVNGRIDLTQAEAVIDIINAKTQRSLELAAAQATGGLGASVQSIRGAMMDVLVKIEADIDFADDTGETIDSKAIIKDIHSDVLQPLRGLLDNYRDGHILREGLKLIVVGKPNVGKSSLMNQLLQKDRVIVTPVPGTTRDLIEETINIRGIPVIVTDSAGLHETDDPVESIGIRKTHEYISESDLVLFMVDASGQLAEEDFQIYDRIKSKRVIIVQNKSDLVKEASRLDIPQEWKNLPAVETSALYGCGFDALKALIAETCLGQNGVDAPCVIVPNIRQKKALEKGLKAVESAVQGIADSAPYELIAIDMKEAIDSLGEIVGATIDEDVLDQIFSRFCIGK